MKHIDHRLAFGLLLGLIGLGFLIAATPKPELVIGRYQLSIGKFTTQETKSGQVIALDGIFRLDTASGRLDMLHLTHTPDKGIASRWVSMEPDK